MGVVTPFLLTAVLRLQETPSPSPTPVEPPIDPARVTPGVLGLISVLFLAIAVVLLYRSMRKQMGKVDPNLPMGPGDEERAEDERLTAEAERKGEEDGETWPSKPV